MKKGILSVFVCVMGFRAAAQQYTIDWYKVAGGGGTSSNGQYVVSGTIGQHDAGGPMTGAQYSLTGGFWSIISAVQSPNGPLLRIKILNTTAAKVSWPYPSTGYTLQSNLNLATTNWGNFGGTTTNDGTNWSVTITPPQGNLFFRLEK